jgi:hypothetical protein
LLICYHPQPDNTTLLLSAEGDKRRLQAPKSTLPQNRQLNILIGKSKQQVDGFAGKLTLRNHLIDTFCDMRAQKATNDACKRI